eukprot:759823-Hanusia_phi.AAC.3
MIRRENSRRMLFNHVTYLHAFLSLVPFFASLCTVIHPPVLLALLLPLPFSPALPQFSSSHAISNAPQPYLVSRFQGKFRRKFRNSERNSELPRRRRGADCRPPRIMCSLRLRRTRWRATRSLGPGRSPGGPRRGLERRTLGLYTPRSSIGSESRGGRSGHWKGKRRDAGLACTGGNEVIRTRQSEERESEERRERKRQ